MNARKIAGIFLLVTATAQAKPKAVFDYAADCLWPLTMTGGLPSDMRSEQAVLFNGQLWDASNGYAALRDPRNSNHYLVMFDRKLWFARFPEPEVSATPRRREVKGPKLSLPGLPEREYGSIKTAQHTQDNLWIVLGKNRVWSLRHGNYEMKQENVHFDGKVLQWGVDTLHDPKSIPANQRLTLVDAHTPAGDEILDQGFGPQVRSWISSLYDFYSHQPSLYAKNTYLGILNDCYKVPQWRAAAEAELNKFYGQAPRAVRPASTRPTDSTSTHSASHATDEATSTSAGSNP